MAETLQVFGAVTKEKKDGNKYGLLSVGVEDGNGGFEVAKLFCEAGIHAGFEGPGLYQVDGPVKVRENNGFANLVISPQVLRKVTK